MNKKYGQPKQNNYKSILFWGIIGLITLAFIIAVIVKFVQSRTVDSYDSLSQLEGEELFEASEGKYIVFVYNSEKEEAATNNEFDQTVFNYITFAKRNSSNENVLAIFGFDVTKPENNKVVISDNGGKIEKVINVEEIKDLLIKEGNVPALLVIKDNKITDYKDSDNAISDYLQTIIDENK